MQGARGDAENPLLFLAEAGFWMCSIDYRLTDRAGFPAQIHDVKAAIRWVRSHADELGIDPVRIGIAGHSAGGMLAMLAAVTGDDPDLEGDVGSPVVSSAVQAACAMSARYELSLDWYAAAGVPFPAEVGESLRLLLGGLPWEQRETARQASALWQLHDAAPPMLVMHGVNDDVVPVNQARAFAAEAAHRGLPIKAHWLEGVDHDLVAPMWPEADDPSGLREIVARFFRRTLGT